jgi:hypothetical protein
VKVPLSVDNEMGEERGQFHKKVKLLTTSVGSQLITGK